MKFIKKLLGEKEVEAVLQRLDRLTHDEARTTAAQTLEVVYGLVQNMRVVMDGEQTHLACHALAIEYSSLQTARHPLKVFVLSLVRVIRDNKPVPCLTGGLETIQQMASDKNKSKRQSFLHVAIARWKS